MDLGEGARATYVCRLSNRDDGSPKQDAVDLFQGRGDKPMAISSAPQGGNKLLSGEEAHKSLFLLCGSIRFEKSIGGIGQGRRR